MKNFFYLLILFYNTSPIFGNILFFIEPKNFNNGELSNNFLNNLKKLFNIDIVIETGTAGGENAHNISKIFNEVHTVELYEPSYIKAKTTLTNITNAILYFGDSKIKLPEILEKLKNKNLLIYLDAHWSGSGTGKGSEVTPVLTELEIIKQYKAKPVIIIDDARCFQDDYFQKKHLILEPQEAAARDYPSLKQVKEYICNIDPNYKVFIYGDIIIAFTNQEVNVSPTITAMTYIRLFNPNQDNILEFLNALKIIAQAQGEEKQAIEGLMLRNGLGSPKIFTLYYRLWYILLLLNNKQNDLADMQIRDILDYLIPQKTN